MYFAGRFFVVKDIKRGEEFTEENVRSIRPGYGLHTRHLGEIIGRYAKKDIKCATPILRDMIGKYMA